MWLATLVLDFVSKTQTSLGVMPLRVWRVLAASVNPNQIHIYLVAVLCQMKY